jgi:hypothetical protein
VRKKVEKMKSLEAGRVQRKCGGRVAVPLPVWLLIFAIHKFDLILQEIVKLKYYGNHKWKIVSGTMEAFIW